MFRVLRTTKKQAAKTINFNSSTISKLRPSQRILALTILCACALVIESCQKPTEEFESYESILVSFMENDLDARELYDQNIYPHDTLLIYDERGIRRTLLVESSAHQGVTIRIQSDDSPPVNTSFGPTFWAEARTTSKYYGAFSQTPGASQSSFDSSWGTTLERGALFYKLDGDAAPAKGWSLVAVDMGTPFSNLEPEIEIWRNPGTLDAERLSRHSLAADLLAIRFSGYTYLNKLKVVSGSDSIDIVTDSVFTIVAQTAQGRRELERIKLATGKYHYGFRAPKAVIGGRFYHSITFQEGPGVTVDSNLFRVDISELIDSLFPPDTVLSIRYEYFLDSLITYDSISYYDPFDTICIDTTVAPPDTTACQDSILVIELANFDTTIFWDSIGHVDSIFNTLDTQLVFDTVALPPEVQEFSPGKVWTFPFGVR